MKKLFIISTIPICIYAGLTDFQTIKEANTAYNNKDYNQSIKLYKTLDQTIPEVSYNKANAYYKSQNYDNAINNYKILKV